MNKLKRKFVFLNMIIITSIAVSIAVSLYVSTPSRITVQRLVGVIAMMLVPVCVGSFLSARIAIKPIQASWQRQLDFTADASHELRAPLAVIRSNLELVMDNQNETVGSQMKWLNNIHIETVRVAKLVDDLLTLSRSDTGLKTLEYSRFSLNTAAMEVAAVFEAMASKKGIVIQTIADIEILFWGDYQRIKQLLTILIDNAVKYMDKPGSIKITLAKKDRIIQLAVSDTGKGIAPERLPKIFNRFYRASRDEVSRAENDKQAADGFGLGLSIAEWIVKEHGGTLKAESVQARSAGRTSAGAASRKRGSPLVNGTRFIACFTMPSS